MFVILINFDFFVVVIIVRQKKVDLNFRADDGWLFGEFKGKSGIFPASFTIKLSDLE